MTISVFTGYCVYILLLVESSLRYVILQSVECCRLLVCNLFSSFHSILLLRRCAMICDHQNAFCDVYLFVYTIHLLMY